jgi:hypothetical protein
LFDMQRMNVLPAEHDEEDYIREVLQLARGQTEAQLDDNFIQCAQKLGIVIRPPTPIEDAHVIQCSLSGSADTIQSHHARTFSSGSMGSTSTGLTSRSSHELNRHNNTTPHLRKRLSSKRSLSFTEYEKYLTHHEAQDVARKAPAASPIPIPSEAAPSLFSVSTQRSFASIKNSFRTRFKLRRTKTAQDDEK